MKEGEAIVLARRILEFNQKSKHFNTDSILVEKQDVIKELNIERDQLIALVKVNNTDVNIDDLLYVKDSIDNPDEDDLVEMLMEENENHN